MREIRLSGSEGGGTGNSTGSPYPYPQVPDLSVGAGHARDVVDLGSFFCGCTATLTLGRGNDQCEGCQAVGV